MQNPGLTLVSVLVILIAPGRLLCADALIGMVTRANGQVTARIPGNETPAVLAAGSPVRVGQMVQSTKGNGAQMILTDDTVIQIFPETTLQLNQYGFSANTNRRTAIIRLVAGRARFILSRSRSGDSEFVVETGQAAISAGVSDFIVSAGQVQTEIASLNASISVKNISRLTVGQIRLGACQRTIVKVNTPPSHPEAVTPEQRRAYLKDADYLSN